MATPRARRRCCDRHPRHSPSQRARIALAEFHMAAAHRNFDAAEQQARAALASDPARVAAYAILASI